MAGASLSGAVAARFFIVFAALRLVGTGAFCEGALLRGVAPV